MMNKPNVPETRWYYLGPDNENYGPYMSKDMILWTQSGYFNDTLPIRTENETQYHSLGEWTRACAGKTPFTLNVFSMEALMQQINQVRPPMMIMPPGLAPPFPPPVRFPQFVHPGIPPMMHHQLAPNGAGPQTHHAMHSQPPSEPIDAGSLSHTPDSENDNMGNGLLQQHQRNACVMAEGPQVRHMATETERVGVHDKACQTTPIIIPSKDAARFLSELIGQVVHVT